MRAAQKEYECTTRKLGADLSSEKVVQIAPVFAANQRGMGSTLIGWFQMLPKVT